MSAAIVPGGKRAVSPGVNGDEGALAKRQRIIGSLKKSPNVSLALLLPKIPLSVTPLTRKRRCRISIVTQGALFICRMLGEHRICKPQSCCSLGMRLKFCPLNSTRKAEVWHVRLLRTHVLFRECQTEQLK